MTTEDFEQLRALAPRLQTLQPIGLLSPIPRRSRRPLSRSNALSEFRLFPTAVGVTRRQWDLDEPTGLAFNLLVAANVFMYSSSPARWFRNAFAACSYLLVLDLVRRQRSASSELGLDGDSMRYAVGDDEPRVASRFRLESLGDRLLGYLTYPGGANEFDPDPLHLVALVRGDLPASGEEIVGQLGFRAAAVSGT